MGSLSVVALFLCDCSGTSKKFADQRFTADVEKDGFSIIVVSKRDDNNPETSVSSTDSELVEHLNEWFRARPVSSGDVNYGPMAQAVLELAKRQEPVFPTIQIETARFRVNLIYFPPAMVVLESRSSPSKAWEPASWKSRPEDEALRHWAAAQVSASIKRVAMESGERDDAVKE